MLCKNVFAILLRLPCTFTYLSSSCPPSWIWSVDLETETSFRNEWRLGRKLSPGAHLVSPPVFNPLWIPYPPPPPPPNPTRAYPNHSDTGFAIVITTVSDQTVCYCINCAFCRDVLYHSRMLKDVRADCFCASLQPTKFPCYVMHQARALSSKVNNTWL